MEKQIVLIGSDPELFVGNSAGVNFAIGRVGGSKDAPRPCNFGALQEDNVLLEYNIDPADSLDVFTHHIKAVMEQGRDVLKDFELDIVRGLSSHVFDQDTLFDAGPAAFVFGCEPDHNGWTGRVNAFPRDVNPMLRTAGGHLHIGFGHLEEVSKRNSREVIQMCDFLLGLPSVLLDPDDQRKQLYGKAGAMRFKSYGAEYRTLSNFWLFSDELIAWAYNGARAAYERKDELAGMVATVTPSEVQRIINENDKHAAERACNQLGIAV
ncbi:putative ligase-like domain containing protein [Pseudomonas phage BroderSalsa]|nr:putative ligase-like domain containing protein [Pseudomonas phage BroderSalsa]